MAFWSGIFRRAPAPAAPVPRVEAPVAAVHPAAGLAAAEPASTSARATPPDPIARAIPEARERAPVAAEADFVADEEETGIEAGVDGADADGEAADLDGVAASDASDADRLRLESLVADGDVPQAEAVLAELAAQCSEQEWYIAADLRLGQLARDDERVLACAARLRAVAPGQPKGYIAACALLRSRGRLDAAEEIAREGLERAPGAPFLLREAAEVAAAAGEHDSALARYAELRRRTPRSTMGFMGAIRILERTRQADAARRLIEDGLAAIPKNPRLLLAALRNAAFGQRWSDVESLQAALLAVSGRNPGTRLGAILASLGAQKGRPLRLPGALEQLDVLHQDFPDFVPAYAAHVDALRETGALDEAEARGEAWRARFPADVALVTACARVAEARGDPAEALARLATVRDPAKHDPKLEAAFQRVSGLAA